MKKHDIEIRPLAGTGFDEIADAFLEAFADYNISFSRSQFKDMLKRRGADMGLSFGAFCEGRIVSFIINGIGNFDGAKCAYDTGTGTVKEFRGEGLTDRIFDYSLPFLAQAGVERYVLEVLQENVPAVRIYRRHGFAITREFDCYSMPKNSLYFSRRGCTGEFRRVAADEIASLSGFDSFMPSWQNSIESVKRGDDAMFCIAAYINGKAVGYGVAEPEYGDIAQIAVDREYRCRGVGSDILSVLVEACHGEMVRMVNVESGCIELASFLKKAGFTLACRQFEMQREIIG